MFLGTGIFTYTAVTGWDAVSEAQFRRVHITATATATNPHLRLNLMQNDNVTGELHVREFKLEQGSLATPWVPAPEDTP